ncbi:MAG TPA: hypothetical protein PK566_17825 [Pseudobacteroides sp.]|nr:hypothetical protein [Pseudobacteroides sp.]
MDCTIKLQYGEYKYGEYNRRRMLLTNKPSIAEGCRHWLNPLFIMCRDISFI